MMQALLSAFVGLVSLLLGAAGRAAWREEWRGELREVAATRGSLKAMRVALGTVPDAIAVRRVAARSGIFSAMDFKLAVRMLLRYPGLTLIAVVGMAVAIMIVAGAFSILYTLVEPSLPLPEGDRIVAIQNWDQSTNRAERRTLHDARTWHTDATTVRDIGMFRTVSRNLIAAGTATEPVTIAEISASAFRVAGVAPLMGRALADQDEHFAAPRVVLLGFNAWRDRFHSDPSIVGRTIQLGSEPHAVVGVMPEGFAFPVNHHLWTPLRLDAAQFERRTGPTVQVFGKLAPGATLQSAGAEMAALGHRASENFPATHATLRPRVTPYTYPFFDIDGPEVLWVVHLVQFLISLLLVIVCVNVAILVYARTARRQGEIAVRSALGASRARIVSQLFVEALALAGLAAVIGLGLCAVALSYLNEVMVGMYATRPFWWQFELSTGQIAYVLAMTLVAAAIIGVLPALKATGRGSRTGRGGVTGVTGGGSSIRLGKTWTVLIVAQVAIAVALLPAAVYHAWDAIKYGTVDPGFAAHEIMSTDLALDSPGAAPQYGSRVEDVIRRLQAEPAVADVTFATNPAGQEGSVVAEIDGVPMPNTPVNYNIPVGTEIGHLVRFSKVDPRFFSIFDVPVLTGRAFAAADAGSDAVVVNRAFAHSYFASGPVLGRRVRYVGRSGDAPAAELGRWFEIVGVVSDFPATTDPGLSAAKIYHATTAARLYPATITLHLRGTEPSAFAPRLREITASVDANLQLHRITSLEAALRKEQSVMRLIAGVLAALTLSVMMLSAAGIYSMMSFTVSQRRKEIGIRTALGADPAQILRSIFSRAFVQLALGAVLGVLIAALLELATEGGLMNGNGGVVLPIVASVMVAVGLLAASGPARQGLRVPPTEALRQE